MGTEFIRQKTFYPELCLIQIAFDNTCAIVDTLSPTWHPKTLKPFIFEDFLTLVFHSCRQDLEVLFHLYKELPSYIFDTQIAAVFLGLSTHLGSSLSYHDLVKHYLGLSIDKSQQHTDWMRRPLAFEQVKYAAEDVVYLADIYPMILSDLDHHGRLKWALDEMRSLSSPDSITSSTPSRLSRMGIYKKNYAWAKALFAFQHKHASRLNMNRSRFLSDKAITAMSLCQSKEKLIDFAKRATSLEAYNLLEELCDVFDHTKDQKDDDPLAMPLTTSQQKTLSELRKHSEKCAKELNLPPSFLANAEDLRLYVLQKKGRLLTTWRKEALGLL